MCRINSTEPDFEALVNDVDSFVNASSYISSNSLAIVIHGFQGSMNQSNLQLVKEGKYNFVIKLVFSTFSEGNPESVNFRINTTDFNQTGSNPDFRIFLFSLCTHFAFLRDV